MSTAFERAYRGKAHVKLHERLQRFAYKLGFRDEAAVDLASTALLKAYTAGVVEWEFASACLHNSALTEWRNRKRRNLDYQWTYLDGLNEPEEMRRLADKPAQMPHMEARDVLRRIEAMPEPARTMMLLVAQEWEQAEIATTLGLPIEEVRWRIAYARKQLRAAGTRDKETRGHRRFVGIRRDCRKWQAALRHDGVYYHIGSFDDPERAARAYDEKIRDLGLPEERTNFPLTPIVPKEPKKRPSRAKGKATFAGPVRDILAAVDAALPADAPLADRMAAVDAVCPVDRSVRDARYTAWIKARREYLRPYGLPADRWSQQRIAA